MHFHFVPPLASFVVVVVVCLGLVYKLPLLFRQITHFCSYALLKVRILVFFSNKLYLSYFKLSTRAKACSSQVNY